MDLRNTYVYADWNDEMYPARIAPDRWNGFVIPFFDRETANRVVADQADLARRWPGETEHLEWDGDEIVVTSPLDDIPDRITPTDDGLYPIGAWGWCWVEADPLDIEERA